MKISIVIPVINEVQSINGSIQRAWLAGGDEVIVVDGGSTDGTVEATKKLDCQLTTSPTGRGLQLNRGARMATGNVLLFLHADNWLVADGCQQIRHAWDSRIDTDECEDVDIWGGFQQRIDHQDRRYRWLEMGNAKRVLWRRLVYGDQAMFVSRPLFESVGGFPEQPLMEDFEISRRLAKRHRPVLLDGPVHVSARRWVANGVLRQTINNWSFVLAYQLGRSPEKLANQYRRHDEK